ncbi:MFS transporter [Snodgrassella sp. B3882]|uniref:MFS transporter n=1 Tax=Snodgrassella sp. B3882 TaxID=2818037 RepID=UPI00226A87B1|nr:MFS transporter [Snodgrassella sp. B3882]MCX8745663.1 MFS transporter [Snodgrassella sp. B3882]
MSSVNNQIKHPHWLLFALAVGGFAIGTTEFATMSVLPYIAQGLHISEPKAGHLISIYAIGVVIGAPLIAVFAARFSRRSLLLILMAFFALAHLGTMLAPNYYSIMLFRFLSGLPHGAYFGVGALVAAAMVPPAKRTQAVGLMMIGLTIATTIGVPLSSWLAQAVGWRVIFLIVAVLAAVTVILVALFLPTSSMRGGASNALRELSALTNRQIWLTLAIGAIGFGGMFGIYAYMASALENITGLSTKIVPLVMCLYGVGMTLGNIIIPRLVGRHVMLGLGWLLVWSAAMLALYPFALHHPYWVCIQVVLIGMSGAVGTLLQIRLMDVAKDAQTLAAALNHSAFNAANALGPFLGGLTINAGWGWASTAWVGVALAIIGLIVWWYTLRDERRESKE